MSVVEIATPQGVARVHHQKIRGPKGLLLLGHGAGGSVTAPDLVAAAAVANDAGFSVGLVEQPYRVAGKKSTPRPPVLDEAWFAVVAKLRPKVPVIVGGRSSGARVACRTANEVGAIGVLCLAFPLHPPARKDGTPAPDRLDELKAPDAPVLVIQGRNDRFGMPRSTKGRKVVRIEGDHGLKKDHAALRAAIADWLPTLT